MKNNFKLNDFELFRINKDNENLLQIICQIFGTYYEDNCTDEFLHNSILSAVLEKDAFASLETLSRFFKRMGDDALQ